MTLCVPQAFARRHDRSVLPCMTYITRNKSMMHVLYDLRGTTPVLVTETRPHGAAPRATARLSRGS